jgi:hypothetical protein
MKKKKFREIGRDARTGQIISVEEARRSKGTAVVERVPIPTRRKN